MIPFKVVRSSFEIGRSIADLLAQTAPADYKGVNRAEMIRNCNDVLQDRSDMSLDMLYDLLEQKCGLYYADELKNLKQEITAFYQQKGLRSQRYTKTGEQTYDYRTWDFDPKHPLKIIDQAIFDDAAKHGFPPGFFAQSYFDGVTIYCMPDGADCSHSNFHGCRFSVCALRGTVFDQADFHNTDFHSVLLNCVSFTGAGIAYSHFRDCDFLSVSFYGARLKSCNTIDCMMDHVSFLRTTLDGCAYGRITPSNIQSLETANITMGGATGAECRANRAAIFSALRVRDFQIDPRDVLNKRKKRSGQTWQR